MLGSCRMLYPGIPMQAIPGVPKLAEGLNPATWMLQISTPGMEATLGCDFAEIYQNSKLFQCVPACRDALPLPSPYQQMHYCRTHS